MIKPIGEWMIVELIKDGDKTTESGIVLPGAEKKTLVKKSKVLQISNEVVSIMAKEKRDLQYKVGDIVYHHNQVGLRINAANETDLRMWMKYDAVMGVEK